MILGRYVFFFCAAVTTASTAFAGAAFDLFGGMRQGQAVETLADGTKKTYDVPGSDFGAIIAYRRMGLPFQVGAYVSTYSFKTDEIYKNQLNPQAPSIPSSNSGKITGTSYGPHVRAWLPLGWFQPYAELGYLFGNHKEKIEYAASSTAASYQVNYDINYNTTATLVGLGFRISPIPFFGVILGYEMQYGSRSMKSAKSRTTVATPGTQSDTESDISLTSDDQRAKGFSSGAVRLGFVFSI